MVEDRKAEDKKAEGSLEPKKISRRRFLELTGAFVGTLPFGSLPVPAPDEKESGSWREELKHIIANQYFSLEYPLRNDSDPWNRQRALELMGLYRITESTSELLPFDLLGVTWPPESWVSQCTEEKIKIAETNQELGRCGLPFALSERGVTGALEETVERYRQLVFVPFLNELDPDKPTVDNLILTASQDTGIPEGIIKTIGWRESCLVSPFACLHDYRDLQGILDGIFMINVGEEKFLTPSGKEEVLPIWGKRVRFSQGVYPFLHPHSPREICLAYFRKSPVFSRDCLLPVSDTAATGDQKLNSLFASTIMVNDLMILMTDPRFESLKIRIGQSDDRLAELTGVLFGIFHHGWNVVSHYLESREQHPRARNVLDWWSFYFEETCVDRAKNTFAQRPWDDPVCQMEANFPFSRYSRPEFKRDNFGPVATKIFYRPDPEEISGSQGLLPPSLP